MEPVQKNVVVNKKTTVIYRNNILVIYFQT